MITNGRLTLFIFLIGFILVFINYPIASSAGYSMKLHWDTLSFIAVGLTSILFLFFATNHIHYECEYYLKIRSHFLIEIFILSGITSTLFCFYLMIASASATGGEITGNIIARIGLSFGVSIISLFYGFLFATSTYFLTKFHLNKKNITNKIFNIQFSKIWVSLICLSFIILFKYFEFWMGFDAFGLEFKSLVKSVYIINILFLVIIFSIIVNKNIKIIINSFLNKIQPVELLEQTLNAMNSFIKVISGLSTIIILSTILHLMFNLEGAIIWATFSSATFILWLNFMFIIISKVFELRLRTDLIGQNKHSNSVDKYFLFKYILPVLMVYMIILIFQFIITFFI